MFNECVCILFRCFVRSQCSLVCKWGYSATGSTHGWSDSFLTSIGLQDLIENEYEKIGEIFSNFILVFRLH